MSMKEIEFILNNVLLALQVLLALWQSLKLTPGRALIQGVLGWLLQPFGLSPTYCQLQHCAGRVSKRTNSFVLQADSPSRTGGIEADKPDTIWLWYLGSRFVLERSGSERNMLFINGKMSYYITSRIWEELLTLREILLDEIPAATVDPCADAASTVAASRVALAIGFSKTVFVKGYGQCFRHYWKEVMRGGVMTFDEIVDGIILENQYVSSIRSNIKDHYLLPINLSAPDDNFLKFLNLAAFFLHAKVHWLIPVSLSLISALMEFSTKLSVWLYTNINVFFCYVMHFKPSNVMVMDLKSESAVTPAIISGGAKVEKEGATLVPWLDVAAEENTRDVPVIEKQFRCNLINLTCLYVVGVNKCHIFGPGITTLSVDCSSIEDFRHLITFLSRIAKDRRGSLKSYDSNRKASFRVFRESIYSYVKSGFPPVYELVL